MSNDTYWEYRDRWRKRFGQQLVAMSDDRKVLKRLSLEEFSYHTTQLALHRGGCEYAESLGDQTWVENALREALPHQESLLL